MSFFRGLFGGGNSSKPAAPAPSRQPQTSPDDTIKNMKNTKELLEKKQALLEVKIEEEKKHAARLAPLAKKNPTKKKGHDVPQCTLDRGMTACPPSSDSGYSGNAS